MEQRVGTQIHSGYQRENEPNSRMSLPTEFFPSCLCFTLELVARLNVEFKEVGSNNSLMEEKFPIQ